MNGAAYHALVSIVLYTDMERLTLSIDTPMPSNKDSIPSPPILPGSPASSNSTNHCLSFSSYVNSFFGAAFFGAAFLATALGSGTGVVEVEAGMGVWDASAALLNFLGAAYATSATAREEGETSVPFSATAFFPTSPLAFVAAFFGAALDFFSATSTISRSLALSSPEEISTTVALTVGLGARADRFAGDSVAGAAALRLGGCGVQSSVDGGEGRGSAGGRGGLGLT